MEIKSEKKSGWKLIGHCAVDSGQILLSDPCYVLPSKETDEIKTGNADLGEQFTYDMLFQERNDAEFPNYQPFIFSGIAGEGLVVESGYGDGYYEVYGKFLKVNYKDGFTDERLAEVKIVFIKGGE